MNHNLLVEPVINKVTHGSAIQGKKFSFAFKITNLGSSPSPEFEIKSCHISSAEGQNIQDDFGKKSFHVPILNPGESKIVEVGLNGQLMYGLITIKFTAAPKVSTEIVEFSQKNQFTGENYIVGKDQWIDFFYIKSSAEEKQEKSTQWIMYLTFAIFLFTTIQVWALLSPDSLSNVVHELVNTNKVEKPI